MSVYYSTCGTSEVLVHVNLYSTFQHATAITPGVVFVIEKDEMFKVLREQHALSDRFIKFMPERNIRVEEDLVDQRTNVYAMLIPNFVIRLGVCLECLEVGFSVAARTPEPAARESPASSGSGNGGTRRELRCGASPIMPSAFESARSIPATAMSDLGM
jgi:hypothetical protein